MGADKKMKSIHKAENASGSTHAETHLPRASSLATVVYVALKGLKHLQSSKTANVNEKSYQKQRE